jgi:hypothetical protein
MALPLPLADRFRGPFAASQKRWCRMWGAMKVLTLAALTPASRARMLWQKAYSGMWR